ncbi:MAG: tagaturonate epimerase family protein [Caldilineales bacterium]|nr:tagaturonate epimerase family protein [Caldilineales bacterium]
MRFGRLEIDPRLSPAVLDTATWDQAAAWAAVQAGDEAFWPALVEAARRGAPLPAASGLTPYAPSCLFAGESLVCLAGLGDGQQVLLAVGPQATGLGLGPPVASKALAAGGRLALYPAEAAVLERLFRRLAPDKGPRALGPIPRLGIGTRMTTAVWPAVWRAMAQGGFAANAIQNSVRELNFLSTLLEGQPAAQNIAFGFGAIETGYTGSTFEGLWVAGVLAALKHGAPPRYGADADHIQVKRGRNGLAQAQRMLKATRYYSFYTLDVSDVLDYSALLAASAGAASAGAASLAASIPDATQRRDLLAWHRQPRRIGGFDYRPDDETLGRLVAKYQLGLDAVVALYDSIRALKAEHEPGSGDGAAFDLELSIDEHPNDVPTFACLTTTTELIFVLLEAQRRGVPLTHVAPNFGVEKGSDYAGADGLVGFEARAAELSRIAAEFGVMADFHSGDDLSAATRRAIGRATSGRNHFKVSPYLQLLFAEVLAEHHPDLFRRWWQDALAYAQRQAAEGSAFAAQCLRRSDVDRPTTHDAIFHNFSFAFVGRRDAGGQFICRQEFYALSPAFYQAYQDRLVGYLLGLAEEVGSRKEEVGSRKEEVGRKK